jgi:hypothetical protein
MRLLESIFDDEPGFGTIGDEYNIRLITNATGSSMTATSKRFFKTSHPELPAVSKLGPKNIFKYLIDFLASQPVDVSNEDLNINFENYWPKNKFHISRANDEVFYWLNNQVFLRVKLVNK